MRRVLVAVVALCGLGVAPTPGASAAPGQPAVRVARPADHAGRPSAISEWWELRLVGPGDFDLMDLLVERAPSGGRYHVFVAGRGGSGSPEPVPQIVSASAGRLSVNGAAGTIVVRRDARGASVTLRGPVIGGSLRLSGRPGPAALGFDVQDVTHTLPRATLSWAVLAAGRARGTIRFGPRRVDLTGWRGYYEHAWGRFDPHLLRWQYWDEYVVVGPGDTASFAFGFNRPDTLLPGGLPNDATWIGVTARTRAGGTAVCEPRIRRTGWYPTGNHNTPTPAALTARCGGTRLRFTDVLRTAQFTTIENDLIAYQDGVARVNASGRGIFRHVHAN